MATSSTTKSNTTSHLPDETIKDILSRLPVKSITRFQSLSKPFSALLTSPSFISSHLRRSSLSPLLLLRRFHNSSSTDFSFLLLDPRSHSLRDLPLPSSVAATPLFRFPKLTGSAFGLVCLDVSPCYASSFLIWNVAARKLRALPRPKIMDEKKPIWMVATGFGYNSRINDFNLVRIVNFCRKIDELAVVRAEVFSLSTNSWKLIDRKVVEDCIGSCVIREGQQGVIVNGALYWIATGVGELVNCNFVVCFDLGTLEFSKIEVPDFGGGFCVKVVGFKGSLALAVYTALPVYRGYGRSYDQFELWVPDVNDNGKCWIKLQTFRSLSAGGLGSPVAMLNNGSEVIMKRSEPGCLNLSLIDIHTQFVRRIFVCNPDFTCEFYNYVESLVPINAESEVPEDSL